MADTLTKDAQYLSGRVYNNSEYTRNLGYKLIEKSEDNGNGFYSEAYYKNGKVIVVYRGTDKDKGTKELLKDTSVDIGMLVRNAPSQATNAKRFCEYVERKYPYPILVTGHSLGGSLAQMVASSKKEVKAITFNAFGTGNIKKFEPKYPENVTNYGNAKDQTFTTNLDKHVGKVYMVGERAEGDFYPKKYHPLKDMGDIEKAKEYTPQKQTSKTVQRPSRSKTEIVKGKINEYEEKLKSKGRSKGGKSGASGAGRWVTINGGHVYLGK